LTQIISLEKREHNETALPADRDRGAADWIGPGRASTATTVSDGPQMTDATVWIGYLQIALR